MESMSSEKIEHGWYTYNSHLTPEPVDSQRLGKAIELGKIGIWEFDPFSQALTCNEEFLKIYQFNQKNRPKQVECFEEHIPTEDLLRLKKEFENIEDCGSLVSSHRLSLPNGHTKYIELMGFHHFCSSRERKVITGLSRDITDEISTKMQLESALDLRQRFINNVSHELRTPLTAVIGYLDLLAQTDLKGKQRLFVQKGRLASHSLLKQVDGILTYCELTRDTSQVKLASFVPALLLQNCVARYLSRGRVRDKKQRVTLETETLSFEKFVSDECIIIRVIDHIVDNASKFSEIGSKIELRCAIRQNYQHSQGVLQIVIKDEGCGISEKMLGRIFDGFHQHNSDKFKPDGLGLGLATCKLFCQTIKGNIKVTSELGKGSEFTIELPNLEFRQNS